MVFSSIYHWFINLFGSSAQELEGLDDLYGGKTIFSGDHRNLSPAAARSALEHTLKKWMNDGVKGVWFEVELQDSYWVPILTDCKFEFHHTTKTKIVLTRWLNRFKSTLPNGPFITASASGLVVREDGSVLFVEEKIKPTNDHFLGLPGGYIDPQEEIFEAAEREVREETGLLAKFVCVLEMRDEIRRSTNIRYGHKLLLDFTTSGKKPVEKDYITIVYPFTSIGVGGLVVNQKGEILLMKEQRGIYLGWKFPGGSADPGEEIFQTATREVFEECGVETEHSLTFRYPKTADIYFLCMLKPKDENNITPKPCEHETADCKWFSREEIEKLPNEEFHAFHRFIIERYDKWKASGRSGCTFESFEIPEMKRRFGMYVID